MYAIRSYYVPAGGPPEEPSAEGQGRLLVLHAPALVAGPGELEEELPPGTDRVLVEQYVPQEFQESYNFV